MRGFKKFDVLLDIRYVKMLAVVQFLNRKLVSPVLLQYTLRNHLRFQNSNRETRTTRHQEQCVMILLRKISTSYNYVSEYKLTEKCLHLFMEYLLLKQVPSIPYRVQAP